MSVSSLVWRLASPYDAYVSHVGRLNDAIDRIRYFSEVALGYEAGLQSSVRLTPGGADPTVRAKVFRERLSKAAAEMSDEEFEAFIAHLGGGEVAAVERDRAQAVSRMEHTTRGLEEYFAIAGHELSLLEQRGYNPRRSDIARQLKANHLPPTTNAEYRRTLHELGAKVGRG
jgi:hypothetical protein